MSDDKEVAHYGPPRSLLYVKVLLMSVPAFRFFSQDQIQSQSVLSIRSFSPKVFFLYLLPPIMLDSAYCLHDKHFLDNIGKHFLETTSLSLWTAIQYPVAQKKTHLI